MSKPRLTISELHKRNRLMRDRLNATECTGDPKISKIDMVGDSNTRNVMCGDRPNADGGWQSKGVKALSLLNVSRGWNFFVTSISGGWAIDVRNFLVQSDVHMFATEDEKKPILVVSCGTNDFWDLIHCSQAVKGEVEMGEFIKDWEDVQAQWLIDMADLVVQARTRYHEIVVMGVISVGNTDEIESNLVNPRIMRANEELQKLCSDWQVTYVNTESLKALRKDGIHLTQEGGKDFAKLIRRAVERLQDKLTGSKQNELRKKRKNDRNAKSMKAGTYVAPSAQNPPGSRVGKKNKSQKERKRAKARLAKSAASGGGGAAAGAATAASGPNAEPLGVYSAPARGSL
ncbi:uncharacterized protein LOC129586667 [Paramacrobiotus metropolitanus]|uniref:uncharacterized protein LOC129586667 n=1 Tax=Paramacrobiotus metropolitanus TaxID=2943436 RepID=UPI0024459AF2|nr:uncharacterized protein LOC129586667 [Paramacrobiotus metropolitanus]